MAMRNLLHKTKLSAFESWIKNRDDCFIMPTKGQFEVLRFKANSSRSMPMIFKGKSADHYSCNEASIPFVKQFIRESRNEFKRRIFK